MLVSPLAGRSAGSDTASFVVVEWTDEGGTSRERPIAPFHVHHADDECWYVLDGRLGFLRRRRGGRGGARATPCSSRPERRTPTGTPQDGPTRYLLVIPRRIADLLHELHDGNPKDFAAVFRKYESELL